jgi:hypothetical protein
MNINEFNKKLKPHGYCAVLRYETTTYIIRESNDEHVADIDASGTTNFNESFDYQVLSLIAEYASTPLGKRIPQKKYNVIFWEDEASGTLFVLSKKGKQIKVVGVKHHDLSEDKYIFSELELDELTKWHPDYISTVMDGSREV